MPSQNPLKIVEDRIFAHFPHQPTHGQQEACRAIVEFLYDPDPNSAFILKGYAGTGKTSLISALIQTAPELQISTILLAPTGRAAKVLSSYSGRPAYTIHKKIYATYTDPFGNTRLVRSRNKESYTLFIVDEASMIGADPQPESSHLLLDDLIGYVLDGSHCRLLFLGDTAQLPPVGSDESPALDPAFLSAVSPLHISSCELTEVVRQDHLSGILSNATRLRTLIAQAGQYDEPELPLFSLDRQDDLLRISGADLEELLNIQLGSNNPENCCLITRSNKRANLFNQYIRSRILFREEEINAGDFLMVVKNNYYWLDPESDIGFIANGDIVEVLSVRNFKELYGFHFVDATLRFVDYPDAPEQDCKLILETLHSESPSLTREEHEQLFRQVLEDYADLPNRQAQIQAVKKDPCYNALQIKFAYSLTCHKTQGGQWPTVIIDQGYLTPDMLDRNYLRWLYTALTRSTSKAYLLNFEDFFFHDSENRRDF